MVSNKIGNIVDGDNDRNEFDSYQFNLEYGSPPLDRNQKSMYLYNFKKYSSAFLS